MIPLVHRDGDVRLGRERVLQARPPARRRDARSTSSASSGCGRSSTSKGSARSTSCTCRSGTPVKLTMTSEDVIHSFYVPAFRIKQDVVPGRYTQAWFERDQAGTLSPVLRRVLRHQALGHDRLGRRAWSPADYQAWLQRRHRRAASLAAARASKLFSELGLHHLPPASDGRAAARRSTALFGTTVQLAGRQSRPSPTRPTCANRSSTRRPRSSPATSRIMPTFQGLVSEEQLAAADRLHQVAAAPTTSRGRRARRDAAQASTTSSHA